jgi:hypothetical protein
MFFFDGKFTKQFACLQCGDGHRVSLGHDFGSYFQGLAERGEADVAIVSPEDGFSPLGASRDFFERDLGVSYSEVIRPLADWNLGENPNVTLVAIDSRNPTGLLKGIILAPGNNALSYDRFNRSSSKLPNRSYYYNVTYEAISHACQIWGDRKIAISHLCSTGTFHEDMATCHAEGLAHFCKSNPKLAPESFIFCGCCISIEHLRGMAKLNNEIEYSTHINIHSHTEKLDFGAIIHLEFLGLKSTVTSPQRITT